MNTLKIGSKGSEVQELQSALNRAGYSCTVDGDFGPKTASAVMGFQKWWGLTVDGVAGPKTWAKLSPYLVSAEAFRTAFQTVLKDIEKLPSFKTFSEMM